MWTDVVDLQGFYHSPLGRVVQQLVCRHVREIWPNVSKMSLLGLGYPTPFLDIFRNEATRVIAAMPAAQGVLHWPTGSDGGLTLLTDESSLPFSDQSMDRILLIHCLECSEHLRLLLRETWRLLSGSGRLLIIVPNRQGLWARFEYTPFGHGHPYSPMQISRLLCECLYTPIRTQYGLFMPPLRWRILMSSGPTWESVGQTWFSRLGGVIMIEAIKQVYAGTSIQVEKIRCRRMSKVFPI